MKRLTLGMLLAGAILFVAAESASAQGISIGYGRGWGGRGGGVSVGYYSPNFSIQYGQPYGYGWYGPPGYNYGWNSRPYYGAWNYSTPMYGGRWYSGPSYSGGWYYPGTVYNTPGMWDSPSQRYVTSSSTPSGYQAGYYNPAQATSQVLLHVTVPDPSARVWVEGMPTDQLGTDRFFISPPLEQGNYTYTVRATWMENGREVGREQQIAVTPGQQALASFLQPRGEAQAGTPIAGKVMRVEDERVVITLRDDGASRTYRVSNDTTVMIDGEKAELKALQPGMQIAVTTRAGTTDMATRLEATRPTPPEGEPPIPPR